MSIRVLAISHTDGAGGDSIGRIVSDRLGFRYLDEEIIKIAAHREGLQHDLMADDQRAQYIQRFHAIDTELPTHYDLVLNTDRLTIDKAADIVIEAAR